MTTYITYGKLMSLLYPYFQMNGGEDFMSGGELDMIINLAIQDLINNSSFSFSSTFEHIKSGEDYEGMYKIFRTKEPIEIINELIINGEGEDYSNSIVNTMPSLNSNDFYFKKGTNIIYCNKEIESLVINYEVAFTPMVLSSNQNMDKILPIPFSFIPALIKLIYDHSAPFNFYQGDSSAGDFYGHANTRINTLINKDILSSNHSVEIGNNL